MNRSRLSVKTLKNAGIAFAIGASLVGTPSFGQKEGLARETLEQLITVPPSELSDADLALRIQLNRRLLNDNVTDIGGVKLRALLRADRQEMRRRRNAEDGEPNENAEAPAAEPEADDNNAAENERAERAEERRERRREERRAAREQEAQEQAARDKAAQEQAAQEQAEREQAERERAAEAERQRKADAEAKAAAEAEAQRNAETDDTDREPGINRRARRSLRDDRASGSLTVAELRERIGETEDILQQDGLRRALENALKDRLASDRTALDAKLAARQERREDRRDARREERREERRQERREERREERQERREAERHDDRQDQQERADRDDRNPQANREARRLLEDERPASRLGIPELRDRVRRTREVLREDGLRERLSLRLRERLAEDREELRSRVAQREGRITDRELRKQILENRALRDELLADRRPSATLSDRELDRRIERTDSLLEQGRMRPAVRAGLERMLENDRAEKRERLLAAREERRRKLRREARRPDGFSIELGTSGIQFGVDIVAAEEDHDTIERQLLAPPRRDIERRYTLRDFREQPDLRDLMPGIELDTIRFGTDEAFIRAEEISNLDAIGEIIEEVVYNRPDEIFLIEGHTDAVGSDAYNLRLSEERALAVKEALLDYFNIPEENLITIGYGERYLRIPTPYAEQENRRVSVRRITPLLARN